ncbi:MAG: LuxR C-terminal-related transcriptional regulator [Bacteroidia bacterium]
MKESESDLNSFLSEVQDKLGKKKFYAGDLDALKKTHIYQEQCIYVLNYIDRVVSFQKGVEEMLGYTPDEFTFDFVLNNYHPDDIHIVQRVLSAALHYNTENDVDRNMLFKLCYRTRKKNGDYVKVLRTSANFELNEDGNMVSNISTLTDISFLNVGNKVEWYFESKGLDRDKFRKLIEKSFEEYFSDRQSEIIHLLGQGFSSKDIAERLSISKHTVDTHRRAMLKKANCQNTIELLNFCLRNGIK